MIEVAKTLSPQNFINLARANIVNGYSATCNLLICMFVINNVILHMCQNSSQDICVSAQRKGPTVGILK